MGGVDDGELIGECSMTVVHVHMFTILSSISRQQQILDLAIPLLSNSKILHDCKTLQDSITSLFKIDSMPLWLKSKLGENLTDRLLYCAYCVPARTENSYTVAEVWQKLCANRAIAACRHCQKCSWQARKTQIQCKSKQIQRHRSSCRSRLCVREWFNFMWSDSNSCILSCSFCFLVEWFRGFHHCADWANIWSRSSSAHHLFIDIDMDFSNSGSPLTEQMLTTISNCFHLKRHWTWCCLL